MTDYKPIPVEINELKTLQRDWGQEIFFADTPQYLGKILRMKEHSKGGLQVHRDKDETFYLLSGQAIVSYDDGTGLKGHVMRSYEAYHVPPGAVHQVHAITDCVIVEASTPHYDDRVRMEDHYGRPGGEEGLPTTR